MKISDIVNNLPGKVVTGEEFLDREIKTAYCGDLLPCYGTWPQMVYGLPSKPIPMLLL